MFHLCSKFPKKRSTFLLTIAGTDWPIGPFGRMPVSKTKLMGRFSKTVPGPKNLASPSLDNCIKQYFLPIANCNIFINSYIAYAC